MVGKVALLAALGLVPLHAIEACAIVRAAELIVVARLDDARYSVWPTPAISGRLHIAGLVSGKPPESRRVDYTFDCTFCRPLKQQDISHMREQYGVWFLRKSGNVWTSAFPRSTDPGYAPLGTLEAYKNCLEGRRYSAGRTAVEP